METRRPLLLAIAALVACIAFGAMLVRGGPPSPGPASPPAAPPPDGAHPNILILLIDDLGLDKVGAYDLHDDAPATPHIDALAARGVRFDRAYATPTCSPSRAALLTGRHGRRYGIGSAWGGRDRAMQLPIGERTLASLVKLGPVPYRAEALGKWHLSSSDSRSTANHPHRVGFDAFRGSMGNIMSYTKWRKWVGPESATETTYATTDTVDDAIDRMAHMPEPWLLYVAFHAPHRPLDRPPAHLQRPERPAGEIARYAEVVEALDTELGRLFAAADPGVLGRTDVFLLGDNGTPEHAVAPPWPPKRSKQSLFDGGTRVPLIVAGPDVQQPGRRIGGMVHVVDLFPTVAELVGAPLPELRDRQGERVVIDGLSFAESLRSPDAKPPRVWVFNDMFGPNGSPPWPGYACAVNDEHYKLITRWDGTEHLFAYDEEGKPAGYEGPELLEAERDAEAREAFEALRARRDALIASMPFAPGGKTPAEREEHREEVSERGFR